LRRIAFEHDAFVSLAEIQWNSFFTALVQRIRLTQLSPPLKFFFIIFLLGKFLIFELSFLNFFGNLGEFFIIFFSKIFLDFFLKFLKFFWKIFGKFLLGEAM
jgi:hypothetical protein